MRRNRNRYDRMITQDPELACVFPVFAFVTHVDTRSIIVIKKQRISSLVWWIIRWIQAVDAHRYNVDRGILRRHWSSWPDEIDPEVMLEPEPCNLIMAIEVSCYDLWNLVEQSFQHQLDFLRGDPDRYGGVFGRTAAHTAVLWNQHFRAITNRVFQHLAVTHKNHRELMRTRNVMTTWPTYWMHGTFPVDIRDVRPTAHPDDPQHQQLMSYDVNSAVYIQRAQQQGGA